MESNDVMRDDRDRLPGLLSRRGRRARAVGAGLILAACVGLGMGLGGAASAGESVAVQQPARVVSVEHGVLTISSGDAKFLMSTFSAQSWQEIVRGLGLQPVREFNAMSLVDLMVAAGWEIVGYEVVVVPLANERSQTTERYLMRRLVR